LTLQKIANFCIGK